MAETTDVRARIRRSYRRLPPDDVVVDHLAALELDRRDPRPEWRAVPAGVRLTQGLVGAAALAILAMIVLSGGREDVVETVTAPVRPTGGSGLDPATVGPAGTSPVDRAASGIVGTAPDQGRADGEPRPPSDRPNVVVVTVPTTEVGHRSLGATFAGVETVDVPASSVGDRRLPTASTPTLPPPPPSPDAGAAAAPPATAAVGASSETKPITPSLTGPKLPARSSPLPSPASPVTCGGRAATIVGSDDGDVLRGTPGDDVIVGGNGPDRILGLDGDDTICGGNGQDQLDGGAGADHLIGGRGADTLIGGPGADRFDGGNGKDVIQDP